MSYHYNLKLIHSGKRTEVFYYDLAQQRGTVTRNENGRKGKNAAPANREKNRKEVLVKARNNIIRLVNCNPDLLAFITFTYSDNMVDIMESKKHMHKMLSKIQRKYKQFKYLYVLEFQERGAIHYHMLCNYPIDFKCSKSDRRKTKIQKEKETEFMHEFWEDRGFVDIRDLSQEGNTNAGLYVSTYIVKALEGTDLNGSRIYGYSRNMTKPCEETMLIQENRIGVLREMNKNYELTYANSYEQVIDYGDEIKNGVVSYYDFWRREDE